MLDNEINRNEQVKVARMVDSLSALHSEVSSTSHYMPQVPKGGVIMKVHFILLIYIFLINNFNQSIPI